MYRIYKKCISILEWIHLVMEDKILPERKFPQSLWNFKFSTKFMESVVSIRGTTSLSTLLWNFVFHGFCGKLFLLILFSMELVEILFSMELVENYPPLSTVRKYISTIPPILWNSWKIWCSISKWSFHKVCGILSFPQNSWKV